MSQRENGIYIRAIGVSHTAFKDELRQNVRSHSQIVFLFLYYIRFIAAVVVLEGLYGFLARHCHLWCDHYWRLLNHGVGLASLGERRQPQNLVLYQKVVFLCVNGAGERQVMRVCRLRVLTWDAVGVAALLLCVIRANADL